MPVGHLCQSRTCELVYNMWMLVILVSMFYVLGNAVMICQMFPSDLLN